MVVVEHARPVRSDSGNAAQFAEAHTGQSAAGEVPEVLDEGGLRAEEWVRAMKQAMPSV
jgi:hypothetical protein